MHDEHCASSGGFWETIVHIGLYSLMVLLFTSLVAGNMKNTSVARMKTTAPRLAVQPSQSGRCRYLEVGSAFADRALQSKHTVGMRKVICCRTTALETIALKALDNL